MLRAGMSPSLRLLLVGDVMLGRLVDQLFPEHVDDPEHAEHATHFVQRHPEIGRSVAQSGHAFPWGTTLSLFRNADVKIINLETAVTLHPSKDPVNKAFNYRMHPSNAIGALRAASVNAACIANNHIFDWSAEGMRETRATLKSLGVAFSGAGNNLEEAWQPAVFEHQTAVFVMWSAADHYDYWAASATKPGINFLDVEAFEHVGDESQPSHLLARLKKEVPEFRSRFQHANNNVVAIFSVHWGSNYAWQPTKAQRRFARALIDEAGIDIIHGHSSHHVKGIEIYKGKPILYGCGDFVDDYAVDPVYRNNLSFAYELLISAGRFVRMELIPTKITMFQVNQLLEDVSSDTRRMLSSDDLSDRSWLENTMTRLCQDVGTRVAVQNKPYRLVIPIAATE